MVVRLTYLLSRSWEGVKEFAGDLHQAARERHEANEYDLNGVCQKGKKKSSDGP